MNDRITIGAAWMIGLRQADRLIGLVSMTILARLLLPEDFGLVVYATTFIAMLELFFQFGFETVLIRDQDAGRDSYDTAWTLEIIKGGVVAILMVFGAGPIANFFDEPAVELVVYFLAALPVLNGFKNIGIVDFQKSMNFDLEFKYRFSVRLVSAITTAVLAYVLRSHWALVYGMIFNATLSLILSYIMSPYRPSICLAESSRIFGFSKWILAQNMMYGINERLMVIVLGRMFEARVAAIYNMGFELSNLASAEFAMPIRRVLFPGIATLAEDEGKMVETLVRAIGIIAFVGLPMTIGIAATAPIFVPLLLGPNWSDVVPIIQILAINGVALVLYSNSHVMFYALDKPQLTAYITALRLGLLLPVALLLVPNYGALGAAWALSITNVIVAVAEYVLFFHLVSVRPSRILEAVWRSIVGVTVMGGGVYSIVNVMLDRDDRMPLILELSVAVLAGAAIYVSVTGLCWMISRCPIGAESYLIKLVKNRLGGGAADSGS